MRALILVLVGCLLLTVSSCNMQKDIDVPLPAYESKPVVECYLEAGQPFRMILMESVSYFSSPSLPEIKDASVSITCNDKVIKLDYSFGWNPKTRKGYNYISKDTMAGTPNTDYKLEITDTKGRKITGQARLLPFVPITQVEWKFNRDSLAYVLVHFNDDPSTTNYYRFQIHKDSITHGPDIDFVLSDSFTNGQEITLGTGFNYEKGDTVFATLYHIEKSFYDFMESTEAAANANGNPFAQPAQIKSTVQGGLGIFTTLVYERKKIVIQ